MSKPAATAPRKRNRIPVIISREGKMRKGLLGPLHVLQISNGADAQRGRPLDYGAQEQERKPTQLVVLPVHIPGRPYYPSLTLRACAADPHECCKQPAVMVPPDTTLAKSHGSRAARDSTDLLAIRPT